LVGRLAKRFRVFGSDLFTPVEVIEIIVHYLDELEFFEVWQVKKSVKDHGKIVFHGRHYSPVRTTCVSGWILFEFAWSRPEEVSHNARKGRKEDK
jgi:hypothetical protein